MTRVRNQVEENSTYRFERVTFRGAQLNVKLCRGIRLTGGCYKRKDI